MKLKGFALIIVFLIVSSFLFSSKTVFAAAGTTWTKEPSNPVLDGDVGAWDEGGVYHPAVILDGSTYKMWYQGMYNFTALGYATSTDGVAWAKSGSNPVLQVGTTGEWDASEVSSPTVIKDGSTYKMWYTGVSESYIYAIGYATSADGITWAKSGSNPVLNVGDPGAWDAAEVGSPTVIKDGSTYKMWYQGYSNDTGFYTIGYATSADGITWAKSGSNPVLNIGLAEEWDEYNVKDPTVTFNGCDYEMWYSGNGNGNPSIGYATSSDGVTWAKSDFNPVLTTGLDGVDWDEWHVDQPSVLRNGATYYMWYEGAKFMGDPIGLATAPEASSCAISSPTPTPTPPTSSVTTPTCPDPAPAGPPQLLLAQSTKQGEVTLLWQKAPGFVTNYTITYGLSSKNYIYGAQDVGNILTYTVGGLKPNTTYYFAVRAVNGCAPGPLSNEGSSGSLPLAGESSATIIFGFVGLLSIGIGVGLGSLALNQKRY